MRQYIREIISFVGGYMVYLLGGFDLAMEWLAIAIFADFLSGTIKAIYFNERSNDIFYLGVLKKLGILLMLVIVTMIDRQQGAGGNIRQAVIYALTINESLSSLENLGEMDVPLADKIYKLIQSFKKNITK